jgi:hypothetical protein
VFLLFLSILTALAEPLPNGIRLTANSSDYSASEWKITCQAIGQRLQPGKGPWGIGVAERSGCYLGSQLVAGKDVDQGWQLEVTGGVQSIILRHPDSGDEATLPLPPSPSNKRYLDDAEFLDLVLFALFERSPIAIKVTPQLLRGRKTSRGLVFPEPTKTAAAGQKFDWPEPWPKLHLFQPQFKDGLWIPGKVLTAQRSQITSGEGGKPGRVVYRVVRDNNRAIKAKETYAAHFVPEATNALPLVRKAHARLEAASRAGKLDDYLTGKTSYVSIALAETTAAGYIGARYGRQILAGEGSLKEASLIGVLFEVRGGPASGLRYYYDSVPRAGTTELSFGDPVELYVEWSRHRLGWGFGWDFEWLVNHFDVVPKLGLLRFDSNLATERDGDQLVNFQRFTTSQSLDAGLELGIERRESWFTLRLWASASSGLGGGDNAIVGSQMLGIDLFLNPLPKVSFTRQEFTLALLTFYTAENVQLQQSFEASATEPEPIEKVSYAAGYAGAGLTLAW